LNAKEPHIWSSVLYMMKYNCPAKKCLMNGLKNPAPTQEDILHFHQFTGDGDAYNDLLMNRDNMIFTLALLLLFSLMKSFDEIY